MFKNRKDAALQLCKELAKYKNDKTAVVLAIPRGGVVLGNVIAKELNIKLSIIVIKKIGHPINEELALGAVSIDDYYINEDAAGDVPKSIINQKIKEKQALAKKRYDFLIGNKKPISLKNKNAIIVDDGIATGATMLMAIKIIRKQKPKKIIVAIPVAPQETAEMLMPISDEFICLSKPVFFVGIGQFYEDFTQVEDDEAKRLLEENQKNNKN